MKGLAGKRIVIAGGATGVGAATALRLAEEGSAVVVGDINMAGARSVAERIVAKGGSAIAFEFDLSDEKSVAALIQCCIDNHGGIDGLVNVGADLSAQTMGRDADLLGMLPEVWHRTLTVNLMGYALTSRAALPHLVARGGGAIVNVSSGSAWFGETTRPAYAASKAGVHALTRHTARRWGADNIRANCVALGIVLTENTIKVVSEADKEQIRQAAALKRLGEPEEPAALICFLLSDDAAWITGQVWNIDGGLLLRE